MQSKKVSVKEAGLLLCSVQGGCMEPTGVPGSLFFFPFFPFWCDFASREHLRSRLVGGGGEGEGDSRPIELKLISNESSR